MMLTPARKITKSKRNVTGHVSHRGTSVRYESPLERDFYELMRADPEVEAMHGQPIKVVYSDAMGSERFCFPDALIHFKSGSGRLPLLCEVKDRQTLRNEWHELKPKLKAARAYASSKGWKYKIFTEGRIRTPFLQNAKFLRAYLHMPFDQFTCSRLVRLLLPKGDCTIKTFAEIVASDLKLSMLEAVPWVWHLVAKHSVLVDLNVPLQMTSHVRSPAQVASV